MTSPAAAPIPVTVVGGYLGAGKTTLVNHLLRTADGLRLAILVNEFGTLPIDADLIEARDERMIAIAGGCVCCSYGSDLVASLMEMTTYVPRPDHIIIETSGVALPGMVASTVTLVAGLSLDAVVVLADAETVRARADDRFTGDTITRQLADADIVLLNKMDLVQQPSLESLFAWARASAPQAAVVTTSHAGVSPALVLGQRLHVDANSSWPDTFASRGHGASTGHHSVSLVIDHAVDAEQLARALADDHLGLVRAKGFVAGPGDQRMALQVVGRRWAVSAASRADTETGHIVAITAGAPPDRARLNAVIGAAKTSQNTKLQSD